MDFIACILNVKMFVLQIHVYTEDVCPTDSCVALKMFVLQIHV